MSAGKSQPRPLPAAGPGARRRLSGATGPEPPRRRDCPRPRRGIISALSGTVTGETTAETEGAMSRLETRHFSSTTLAIRVTAAGAALFLAGAASAQRGTEVADPPVMGVQGEGP